MNQFPYLLGRAYLCTLTDQVVHYSGPSTNFKGETLPWFDVEPGVRITHTNHQDYFKAIGSYEDGSAQVDVGGAKVIKFPSKKRPKSLIDFCSL